MLKSIANMVACIKLKRVGINRKKLSFKYRTKSHHTSVLHFHIPLNIKCTPSNLFRLHATNSDFIDIDLHALCYHVVISFFFSLFYAIAFEPMFVIKPTTT